MWSYGISWSKGTENLLSGPLTKRVWKTYFSKKKGMSSWFLRNDKHSPTTYVILKTLITVQMIFHAKCTMRHESLYPFLLNFLRNLSSRKWPAITKKTQSQSHSFCWLLLSLEKLLHSLKSPRWIKSQILNSTYINCKI